MTPKNYDCNQSLSRANFCLIAFFNSEWLIATIIKNENVTRI
ncbi:hypothetical protein SLEP1_g16600 [Rubroshorea leprosula]|uniref:Uncharacterized protein n=1 Tax=Rubroshorea leprosula TaxID=152421 RepID=A0AAV5J320_9ROSI|nr:hypothetical protein SLEP1_g16600 [Rubroshorea leprosula]